IDLAHPGQAITFAGAFVQPGDRLPPTPGDLNGDGVIDGNDWAAFKVGAGTSLDGLSKADAYLLGDLDSDGVHSLKDVALFRQYYEQANGAASFAALQAVPEPTTFGIVVVAGVIVVAGSRLNWRRRRRLIEVALMIAIFIGYLFADVSVADQTLYQQDFES